MMLCKPLEKTDLPLFLAAVNPNNWVGEIKEDGDRIRMKIENGKATLFNRRNIDVSFRYPEFANVNLPDCLIDGEITVKDENGVSVFNEGITHRSHCKDPELIKQAKEKYPAIYVGFDLIELNGVSLRDKPLRERIKALDELNIDQLDNFETVERSNDIQSLWNKITGLNGEGIIIKDLNSLYHEGKRTASWRKVKDIKEIDLKFVKYETHNRGITVTSDRNDIRVNINGVQSGEVASEIDNNGVAIGTVRHLGKTESGKLRQPTWMKIVR